jgi:hypothetical protein
MLVFTGCKLPFTYSTFVNRKNKTIYKSVWSNTHERWKEKDTFAEKTQKEKRVTNLPLSKSGMSAVSKMLCWLFGSWIPSQNLM